MIPTMRCFCKFINQSKDFFKKKRLMLIQEGIRRGKRLLAELPVIPKGRRTLAAAPLLLLQSQEGLAHSPRTEQHRDARLGGAEVHRFQQRASQPFHMTIIACICKKVMPPGAPSAPPGLRDHGTYSYISSPPRGGLSTEKIVVDTRWWLCAIMLRSACEVKRTAK